MEVAILSIVSGADQPSDWRRYSARPRIAAGLASTRSLEGARMIWITDSAKAEEGIALLCFPLVTERAWVRDGYALYGFSLCERNTSRISRLILAASRVA